MTAPAAGQDSSSGSLLSVRNIAKRFGAVAALNGVTLDVGAGEIRAICGENGAGKSTLVKILTGVYHPDAGSISIKGRICTIANPRQAQEKGIALVAQELSVCPDLSVEDNIWLGSINAPFLRRSQSLRSRARQTLDLLGAPHIELDTRVDQLTLGERQIVEIARMLNREARILILDEPTATLSDAGIERIFAALVALKQQGRAILYITHRLGEVFQICDSVTVLRNGTLVETKRVTDVSRRSLIEMMLGRPFVEMYPEPVGVHGDAALEVDELSIPGKVSSFGMRVRKGEIVCIVGQIGSGMEDVVRALAGLTYNATGRISVYGRPLDPGSTSRAQQAGIMYVSGDRAEEGIFRHLSVLDNLTVCSLQRYQRWGVLKLRALKDMAQRIAEVVGIGRGRLRSPADLLSGGNQQKLAFGRYLDQGRPGVMVLNEPTRGVDVGAKAEIYRLARQLCADGCALIVASSDLEEIIGLGDEVITMYRGTIVGHYRRADATMQRIVADITHPVAAPENAS